MKLRTWPKQQGIGYRNSWQWFKDGKLPADVIQTVNGTILVKEAPVLKSRASLYARMN